MNAVAPIAPQQRLSILQTVANRYNMEPAAFEQTLRATVVPQNCTKEQFAACLVVANEYRLNPLTREIFFFPARGGGIVPMVGVDGWCRIINEHPAFDGMEFETVFQDGKPFSVTSRMFRKDRVRPIAVTEFYSECFRPTDPWKTAPARMLRHKAMIQAARYAFGFSGIYDEDDAEKIRADNARDVTPPPQQPAQAAVTSLRPPSPPKAAHAPQTVQVEQPPADTTDWRAELDSYRNRIGECETEDSLVEAIEMFGGVFDDAADVVQSEARAIEAAHRAEIGDEATYSDPREALIAEMRSAIMTGEKRVTFILNEMPPERRALLTDKDVADLKAAQKAIELQRNGGGGK